MPNKDNSQIIAEQIILEEQTDKELAKKEASIQTQLQAGDILKTKQQARVDLPPSPFCDR